MLNKKLSKQKIKQTNLEKYGVENPQQNFAIKEKTKMTILKKYNTDCVFKNNDIKEKIRKTNIKKYGHAFATKNNKVQEKRILTNIERYGVDHPMKNKKVADKLSSKTKRSFFSEKVSKYNDIIPMFNINEYNGTKNNKYKFKCTKCNTIFYYGIPNGRLPRCPQCSPKMSGSSILEHEIQNWLSEKIVIERNKRFFENKKYKYELDIFIPEKNIGIELNGLYFHSEISGDKDRNYHSGKLNWFKNKGINIIQVWDYEWIEKQDIVKSIILSKILLITNKIYARQCKVGIVDGKVANKFLMENHIQGCIPSNVKVGLFYGDELVSILTLGKSRYNKKYEWEILRFCNALNTNVVGGFSKMLKFFTENYKPKSIITYADARFSDGGLYRKNGFTEMAFSKPNYFYTQKYDGLESRVKYQKHKLKDKLESFNPELTEWENMQLNGFDRVWDCGNYCFVKN